MEGQQQQQEGEAPPRPKQPAERFTSHLLLTDEHILALGIKESSVEQFRRQRYQAAFGIESWYDELKEHTFYTKSVALSYREAEALNKYHYSLNPKRVTEPLTDEDKALVKGLEERIDEAIKGDERLANGAFIKLDTRSPKDVVLYDFENQQVKDLVRKELAELYANKKASQASHVSKEQAADDLVLTPSGKINVPKSERDDNEETSTFVVATSRAMKITSGSEALYLLAHSDRICEDLNKILPFGEALFSINLILREWLDEVIERPQYEFRAFVHQNQFNAMSQYFCFCKYDDLIAREEEVKQTILAFYESVKDRITHSSYVIDFYLAKDNRVLIIELNPFHNGAGAALFSWAKDRERFLHGPFELRITKELKENPKDILPPFWVRYIDSCFQHASDDAAAASTASRVKEEEKASCLLC